MNAQLQQLLQGTAETIPSTEFLARLQSGEKLTIKFGADPSAPDLHLGHLVVLRKLRQFQELGHQIIFIIGDFTAMIGDPTGKSETRKPLTPAAVQVNAQTYQEQIYKILDPGKTKVVFNNGWISKLSPSDLIKLCSQVTVSQILERDDFARRYAERKAIALHEFLYPLVQGYDSVYLESDIEIGGTDQKFNMLVGRQLQSNAGQKPQMVMTMPLLEGLDGVNKMSKSLGNYIAFNDPPNEMFGKLMSLPDNLMEKYFCLLTDLTSAEIDTLKSELAKGTKHPRTAKSELARMIMKNFFSDDVVSQADAEFTRIFSSRGVPDQMTEYRLSEPTPIIKILTGSESVPSSAEGKRLIAQNAVSLDNQLVTDPQMILQLHHSPRIMKVGKRRFLKII